MSWVLISLFWNLVITSPYRLWERRSDYSCQPTAHQMILSQQRRPCLTQRVCHSSWSCWAYEQWQWMCDLPWPCREPARQPLDYFHQELKLPRPKWGSLGSWLKRGLLRFSVSGLLRALNLWDHICAWSLHGAWTYHLHRVACWSCCRLVGQFYPTSFSKSSWCFPWRMLQSYHNQSYLLLPIIQPVYRWNSI